MNKREIDISSLTEKTLMTNYDAENLLLRCNNNYDLALACWTIGILFDKHPEYVAAKIDAVFK